MSNEGALVLPEPNNLPKHVPVGITEPVITEAAALTALRRQGNIKVSADYLKDLSSIGAGMKGVGILNIQRGSAMISQSKVHNILEQLAANAGRLESVKAPTDAKIKKLTKIAHMVGYLASKLTESHQFILEAEGELPRVFDPGSESVTPTQSFKPGARVTGSTQIVAENVHIHPQAQENGCKPKPAGA